jgi:glycosyltransferase involved in cell wall biosynthesis
VGIDVIVTTWGSDEWKARGIATALRNAGHFHHIDNTTISAGAARNHAVEMIDPQDWICFLDADDHLGMFYKQRMWDRIERHNDPMALFAPALQLGHRDARCLDDRDIINGHNPCPIGTLIHRSIFDLIGGFGDEPAWEDFAMFQRAVLIGAEIQFVPGAIYIAADNPRGRNSTVRNPKWLRRQIQADNQRWLKGR